MATRNTVSKTGTPASSAARPAASTGGAPRASASTSAASTNPSRCAPPSPRKMLAGGRLKRRKPAAAPAAGSATGASSGRAAASSAKVTAMSPPTSPSQTSVRFTAFTIPTIHSTARAPSTGGTPVRGRATPPATAASAAAACSASLGR
jgi:hypothetical protein